MFVCVCVSGSELNCQIVTQHNMSWTQRWFSAFLRVPSTESERILLMCFFSVDSFVWSATGICLFVFVIMVFSMHRPHYDCRGARAVSGEKGRSFFHTTSIFVESLTEFDFCKTTSIDSLQSRLFLWKYKGNKKKSSFLRRIAYISLSNAHSMIGELLSPRFIDTKRKCAR